MCSHRGQSPRLEQSLRLSRGGFCLFIWRLIIPCCLFQAIVGTLRTFAACGTFANDNSPINSKSQQKNKQLTQQNSNSMQNVLSSLKIYLTRREIHGRYTSLVFDLTKFGVLVAPIILSQTKDRTHYGEWVAHVSMNSDKFKQECPFLVLWISRNFISEEMRSQGIAALGWQTGVRILENILILMCLTTKILLKYFWSGSTLRYPLADRRFRVTGQAVDIDIGVNCVLCTFGIII